MTELSTPASDRVGPIKKSLGFVPATDVTPLFGMKINMEKNVGVNGGGLMWAMLTLLLLAGCTSTATKKESADYIAAYVPPFYLAMGPVINVGELSQALSTQSKSALMQTIRQMESRQHLLRPEAMYVASIRLYEVGEKETALLWFYRAYYRSRLFVRLLDITKDSSERGSALKKAYGEFHRLVGPYLNGYAGCDLNLWADTVHRVEAENAEAPDLTSIFGSDMKVRSPQTWDSANHRVSEYYNRLAKSIEAQQPRWREMRALGDLDQRHCR
ncbi:hypothetical protein DV711_07045 [Motiliproteus coralliicola]|uniref:Uncharacterized protein n=1 Tax=Motiliproteus coralliicola TaxID=2283196 RepID=A0A369WMR3_9GAMM|nr:hypothetical protein [Motiliproteus coralliicola]RDE22359.1 hypothetical protein DV711_07045 [Motiliproteus coralliicola]